MGGGTAGIGGGAAGIGGGAAGIGGGAAGIGGGVAGIGRGPADAAESDAAGRTGDSHFFANPKTAIAIKVMTAMIKLVFFIFIKGLPLAQASSHLQLPNLRPAKT